MNKKLIIALAVPVLTVILLFIFLPKKGNENTKEPTNGTVQNTEKSEGAKNNEQSNENTHSELLVGTYEVPSFDKNIYVDTPAYHYINKGYTATFDDGFTKFFAFRTSLNSEAKDEKEAFDIAYPSMRLDVQGLHWINEGGETFEEGEYVQVNGIKAYRVKGIVKAQLSGSPSYFYGYSFIYDGVPCLIAGIVLDYDQPQDQIDEVNATVDAMMKTVRSKR